MEKQTLKIKGMDCASCAAVIENTLKKKEGIFSVSVNLVFEKAAIDFDSSKITIERIKKIIL